MKFCKKSFLDNDQTDNKEKRIDSLKQRFRGEFETPIHAQRNANAVLQQPKIVGAIGASFLRGDGFIQPVKPPKCQGSAQFVRCVVVFELGDLCDE